MGDRREPGGFDWNRFLPRAAAVIATCGLLIGIDAVVRTRTERIELWNGFLEGLKQAKAESVPATEPASYVRPEVGVRASVPDGYRLRAQPGGVLAHKDVEPEGEDGATACLVTAAQATRSLSAGAYLQEWMGALPDVLDVDGSGPVGLGDTALHDEGVNAWRVFDGHCGKTAVHGEVIATERRERLELRAFWAPRDGYDKERHNLYAMAQSVAFGHAPALAVQEDAHLAVGLPAGFHLARTPAGTAVVWNADPMVRVTVTTYAGDGGAGDAAALFDRWLAADPDMPNGLVTTTFPYPAVMDAQGLTWMLTGAIITFDHDSHYGRAVALAGDVRSATGHASVVVVRQAPSDTLEFQDAQLLAIETSIRLPLFAGASGRAALPLSHTIDTSKLCTHWASWRSLHPAGVASAPLALLTSQERTSPRSHERFAMPLLDSQPDGSYVNPRDPVELLAEP